MAEIGAAGAAATGFGSEVTSVKKLTSKELQDVQAKKLLAIADKQISDMSQRNKVSLNNPPPPEHTGKKLDLMM